MDEREKKTAPAYVRRERAKRPHETYDREVIHGIKEKVLKMLGEMEREGKETIKIHIVKSTEPHEFDLAAEKLSRVEKRWKERKERKMAENRNQE